MDFVWDDERGKFAARLLASIRQPVIVTDTEFRVVYFNEGAEEALGWSRSDIIGVDILNAAGIVLSEPRAGFLLGQLAAGAEVTEDFEVTRRDGHRFPVLVNLTPFLDESGSFVGLVAIGQDVTDRWAIEDANWRLSAIVESSSDAIVGYDLEGRITSWNAAAAELFGEPASERLGMSLSEFQAAPRFVGTPFEEVLEHVSCGQPLAFQGELTRADGEVLYLECMANPVRDRLGNLVGGATVCRDVSERRRLEERARRDHQRLEEAQQIGKMGSFDLDFVTNRLVWSRELRRIVDWPDDEPPDMDRFIERIHPEDRQVFVRDVLGALNSGQPSFEATYRLRTREGSVRWLHTLGRAKHSETGEVTNVVGSAQDITDRVEHEDARRLAEQQFTVAFEHGSVGMLVLDPDLKIVRVNPTICRMFGRRPEEIIGHSPDEFSHPDELIPGAPRLAPNLLESGRSHLESEWRYLRPDGGVAYTIVHLAIVRDPEGQPLYYFAQVVDITDRKKTEEELERLAMQDPLTGLPNRNLLGDRLANALKRAERGGTKVAVIFVDIDHFKLVNDSLGHSAGDDLLRQIAHRLIDCTRAGDTIARFGGDEFVLVCEDVSDATEATLIGERVGAMCEAPFLIGEQQMYVTVSCGIVVATRDDTAATLLRDADTAMYRAKERGRARCELFDPVLRSRTTKRLDIELALRRAIERDEFHLEYQPIISLSDGMPVSVEALVRWDHPERGLVLPAEFIRSAEDTGLIVPIGDWVLERAIAQTAEWRSSLPGASDLSVCVNLSPRQLTSPTLLERARRFLDSHHLPPDAVCLEITESAAMDDVDVSLPMLRQISDEGILLAVDDFGAGYSSLSRLKRLPFGLLKIDRSFVDGLGYDLDDSLIVNAIVSLGKALGLMLCAEGVETPEQLEVLRELDCDRGQGYVWSKPLPAPAFEQWCVALRAEQAAAANRLARASAAAGPGHSDAGSS